MLQQKKQLLSGFLEKLSSLSTPPPPSETLLSSLNLTKLNSQKLSTQRKLDSTQRLLDWHLFSMENDGRFAKLKKRLSLNDINSDDVFTLVDEMFDVLDQIQQFDRWFSSSASGSSPKQLLEMRQFLLNDRDVKAAVLCSVCKKISIGNLEYVPMLERLLVDFYSVDDLGVGCQTSDIQSQAQIDTASKVSIFNLWLSMAVGLGVILKISSDDSGCWSSGLQFGLRTCLDIDVDRELYAEVFKWSVFGAETFDDGCLIKICWNRLIGDHKLLQINTATSSDGGAQVLLEIFDWLHGEKVDLQAVDLSLGFVCKQRAAFYGANNAGGIFMNSLSNVRQERISSSSIIDVLRDELFGKWYEKLIVNNLYAVNENLPNFSQAIGAIHSQLWDACLKLVSVMVDDVVIQDNLQPSSSRDKLTQLSQVYHILATESKKTAQILSESFSTRNAIQTVYKAHFRLLSDGLIESATRPPRLAAIASDSSSSSSAVGTHTPNEQIVALGEWLLMLAGRLEEELVDANEGPLVLNDGELMLACLCLLLDVGDDLPKFSSTSPLMVDLLVRLACCRVIIVCFDGVWRSATQPKSQLATDFEYMINVLSAMGVVGGDGDDDNGGGDLLDGYLSAWVAALKVCLEIVSMDNSDDNELTSSENEQLTTPEKLAARLLPGETNLPACTDIKIPTKILEIIEKNYYEKNFGNEQSLLDSNNIKSLPGNEPRKNLFEFICNLLRSSLKQNPRGNRLAV